MIFNRKIRSIIFANLLLGLVVALFVWFEISETEEELAMMRDKQTTILSDLISSGIKQSLISTAEIENQMYNAMSNYCDMIYLGLEKEEILQNSSLSQDAVFCYNTKIPLDQDSNEIVSNQSLEYIRDNLDPNQNTFDFFDTFEISGKEDSLYIFSKEYDDKDLVLIAFRPDHILNIRRNVGLGSWMAELERKERVIYFALQDTIGILAATRNIEELSSINSDTVLNDSWFNKSDNRRLVDFNDDEVFEIIHNIEVDAETNYLARLAIDVTPYQNIKYTAVKRAIQIGLGIFISGALLIVILVNRTKVIDLKEKQKITENYLNTVFNNVNDIIITCDSELNINSINAAAEKFFGLDQKKISSLKLSELVPDIDLDNQNLIQELQLDINKKKKHLILSKSELKDSLNNSILIIARDISEQKHYMDLLHRKEKMSALGDLAASLAHEIRNPLNSISLISQRFKFEFAPTEDNDEYQKLVNIVISEIDRLDSIINQFLNLAKSEDLELRLVNFKELISETILLMEESAKKKNIQIFSSLEDLQIQADNKKMKQVLINLIKNSIEAVKEEGSINVSLVQQDQNAILEIIDSGTGIENDEINKVFDMYYSTKEKGLGIGLSLVYQILKKHNADISIKNNNDKGLTVTIKMKVN